MTRRRAAANTVIHLTGSPGSRGACARISGHLVVEHHEQIAGFGDDHFAGARVELAPGMTIYAADVGLLYRLTPAGWVECDGPPASPELTPPPAPRPARPPARSVPTPPVTLRDATDLLRAIGGALK